MVWQDTPSPPGAHIDAEQEREMRLISQARAGADWALAALVARYQPMVVRYLTRLVGDPELARKLAENVFVRMERRLRGPHGGEYLRLWLLRASTEDGLEALRRPRRGASPRLEGPGLSTRLLAERVRATTQPLRERMGKLAEKTTATGRQVRQLIWATEPDEHTPGPRAATAPSSSDELGEAEPESPQDSQESIDPRAALRHRLVRAVLAEIPYGDAQCLALHLVAGLNQAEVAQALGIRASAARKHIVLGLEIFAQRYETALASLGIPPQLAYGDLQAPAEAVPEVAATAAEPAPVTIETTAVPIADDEPPSAPAAAEEVAGHADDAALEPAGILADVEPEAQIDRAQPALSDTIAAYEDEEPPFIVEPPLWQAPELADGALPPMVLPIGPILETTVVAASPDLAAQDASISADTALDYESAMLPTAPPVVVPVLSHASDAPSPYPDSYPELSPDPDLYPEQPQVVPVLTGGDESKTATTAPTTMPRVVPVRTPGT